MKNIIAIPMLNSHSDEFELDHRTLIRIVAQNATKYIIIHKILSTIQHLSF